MPRLNDRLAEFFRRRPGSWIDGRELASVGGVYAWRSRLSELRRPPFSMQIENRVRRVSRGDGLSVKVSEYRFVPQHDGEALA
jgi:hypothetical protein